jgi:hypothetical protein
VIQLLVMAATSSRTPTAILIMAGLGLCGLSLVWRKLIKM